MITCRICNAPKDASAFHYRKDSGKYRSECKPCLSVIHRNNYSKNKEKRKLNQKKYYEDNKDQVLTYFKQYRKDNKNLISERRKEYDRRYFESNAEKVRESKRAWTKRNHSVKIALGAARRAKERNATPSWLSETHLREIKDIYKSCQEISEATGVQHHVDHIYPIAGKNGCGLHVPWNLQILPASDNFKKSNKSPDELFIPDEKTEAIEIV